MEWISIESKWKKRWNDKKHQQLSGTFTLSKRIKRSDNVEKSKNKKPFSPRLLFVNLQGWKKGVNDDGLGVVYLNFSTPSSSDSSYSSLSLSLFAAFFFSYQTVETFILSPSFQGTVISIGERSLSFETDEVLRAGNW